MRRLGLGLLLVSLSGGGAVADKKMHACSLLTAGDITGATGMKVGPSNESDMVIPEGPSKGETMAGCMWKVGDTGMVTVSVIRALQGPQREAGLAKLREVVETLKKQGWGEQKKDFGNIKCSLLTPPPGQKGGNLPNSTGCMGEAKGMGISVGAMMGGTTKVAMDKVKALFDKVVGRL